MQNTEISQQLQYRKKTLYFEGVNLIECAQNEGTPLYVYSKRMICDHYDAYASLVSESNGIVCYSVKASSNINILKLLGAKGSGCDVVSGGELFRALKAGISPQRIVFSGVCKTEEEIIEAIQSQILMMNVESIDELISINRIAGERGVVAPIGFRINPDVNPKTHPYITTGFKTNKFGISEKEASSIIHKLSSMKHLQLKGLSFHIGSQITTLDPFIESIEKVLSFIKSNRLNIEYINLGGGLGINYHDDRPPSIEAYGKAISKILKGSDWRLILEPGRSIIGNAGIVLGRVHYIKNNGYRCFYLSDLGMNDIIRPSLYKAHHEFLPCLKTGETEKVDLVGPICESTDTIFKEREVQRVRKGDYFALLSAGAYGFTMSSNYNSRPRAAEVLIDGSEYHVIRRRETYEDLTRGEIK